jgi:hypothetical protein
VKNKIDLPKQKSYYDIKVEALVPTTLIYKVLAEDERDALNQIANKAPNGMKPNLLMKRVIKATIYIAGTTMIKLVKHFR